MEILEQQLPIENYHPICLRYASQFEQLIINIFDSQ